MSNQYRALREGAAIVDRSRRGRLLVTGNDRRTYLQGLLTNDIEALGPGSGCYAAYLTPQGRMIADMRVFEMGDAILIDLEGFVAAAVRDRLTQFVFSEDVEIHDLSEPKAQVGVYGPRAPSVLSKVLGKLDAGHDSGPALSDAAVPAGSAEPAIGERAAEAQSNGPSAAVLEAMPMLGCARWEFPSSRPEGAILLKAGPHAPVYVLRSDDPGVPGFDLVIDAALRDEVSAALRSHGAVEVDESVVETTRIEAGRPRFGIDMDADTIPLEAAIEDRAISRTKGCYVGQEVIIRVIDRGQGRVARRLVGLKLMSSVVPAGGDVIRAGDREIGRVTSAAYSPLLETAIALGYVHRDFTKPGTAATVGAVHAIVVATPFL